MLLPFPEGLLKLISRVVGCEVVVQRLCGSLQVDIEKTKKVLGWAPPYTPEAELKRTALHYLNSY